MAHARQTVLARARHPCDPHHLPEVATMALLVTWPHMLDGGSRIWAAVRVHPMCRQCSFEFAIPREVSKEIDGAGTLNDRKHFFRTIAATGKARTRGARAIRGVG